MRTRRLLFYLGLNAAISATATLAVMWVWERAHTPPSTPTTVPSPAVVAPPTATPAPPGPPPTPTLTVHVVQPGDTLGSIAVQYDVSVADLMAANGLTDPDTLDVGQALIIPVGGFGLPTASEAP